MFEREAVKVNEVPTLKEDSLSKSVIYLWTVLCKTSVSFGLTPSTKTHEELANKPEDLGIPPIITDFEIAQHYIGDCLSMVENIRHFLSDIHTRFGTETKKANEHSN